MPKPAPSPDNSSKPTSPRAPKTPAQSEQLPLLRRALRAVLPAKRKRKSTVSTGKQEAVLLAGTKMPSTNKNLSTIFTRIKSSNNNLRIKVDALNILQRRIKHYYINSSNSEKMKQIGRGLLGKLMEKRVRFKL
tara:strand:- start:16991 stop:17392 length:402 start_codon:yes stop_codon:yes gene_type:complete